MKEYHSTSEDEHPMMILRLMLPDDEIGLGVVVDNRVLRIDEESNRLRSVADLLTWSMDERDVTGSLAEIARSGQQVGTWDEIVDAPVDAPTRLLPPVDLQEIWAAGVTYRRSREAREEESRGSGIYDRVYDAERPEIFFKATPSRVSGHGDDVRIRADSGWNVPEAELALVLNPALQIVGYTIGNDVSSRDIEGENPLYLPQAKVYRQCCALGPGILLAEHLPHPGDTRIDVTISRDGSTIWTDTISTSQMKRSFADLVAYLGRDNLFPHGAVLLTGTGMVPPPEVTLQAGDVTTIEIDGIGRLRNSVVQDSPVAR